MTWHNANDHCTTFGAELPTLTTAETADRFHALNSARNWLGYTDEANEGVWVDRHGNEINPMPWSPGQPDNNGGGGHYAIFNWSPAKVDDHSATYTLPHYCVMTGAIQTLLGKTQII